MNLWTKPIHVADSANRMQAPHASLDAMTLMEISRFARRGSIPFGIVYLTRFYLERSEEHDR